MSTDAALKQNIVSLTVNGRAVQVPKGATVLEAAKAAHIRVPVLCYHPAMPARSTCRICLVDVGGPKPLPACSTEVQEDMAVSTDTAELKDFRRFELEMLLARHPNECMRCEAAGQCKFQDLIQEEYLEEKWPKVERGSNGDHNLEDHSSEAIQRDISKCIDCGLCAQVCGDHGQKIHAIGFAERGFGVQPVTVFDQPLSETPCIGCGQCTLRCPTGALSERPDWRRVLETLDGGRRTMVAVTAPSARLVAEEFGFGAGEGLGPGRMVAGLRALGFDYVCDVNLAADLTIAEEACEAIARVKSGGPLPLFTSCCPGWINWMETNRPDLLPHLSSCRSPQMMMAAVVKRGPFARGIKLKPGEKEPFLVSVMPCTAKKSEAVRPGLAGDVNAVITTRELAKMLRHRNVPFASLPPDEVFDSPLGESTGAAMIFGASGGVMEAAMRQATKLLGMEDAPLDWHGLRGVSAGVKVAEVPGLGATVAAVSSIGALVDLLKDPDEAWRRHLMIEVMSCKGGCLGGGGSPKSDDPEVLNKRAAGIYRVDSEAPKRRSDENEEMQQIYRTWLGEPNSPAAERELHCAYHPRDSPRAALAKLLDAVDRRDAAEAAALFAPEGAWQLAPDAAPLRSAQEVVRHVESLGPNLFRTERHTFMLHGGGLEVEAPGIGPLTFSVELESPQRIRRVAVVPLAEHPGH